MKVYGQLVFPAIELFEIVVKPVRKRLIQVLYPLAILPARNCCPAFAGVIGNGHGKPLVLRGGPKCRFAESRMAHYGHSLFVHIAVTFHIVHHLGKRPRPDTNGTPAAAVALYARLLCKPGMETIIHHIDIRPIELQIPVISSDHSISARKDELDRPSRSESPPALLVGVAFGKTELLGITCPPGRNPRTGVDRNRLVAGIIQPHKYRSCTGAVIGQVDERSEEHTSELQSRENLVCRLL